MKWGSDLVFGVGERMFAAVDLEPPHGIGFKCSPEAFAALTERGGMIPAPHLARAMRVKEEGGPARPNSRKELEVLLAGAYGLVAEKLPSWRRESPTHALKSARRWRKLSMTLRHQGRSN